MVVDFCANLMLFRLEYLTNVLGLSQQEAAAALQLQ